MVGQTPDHETGPSPRHRGKLPLWLWVSILAYIVTFSALSIRRHNTYHSRAHDLAVVTQVTWNTAHGRLFEVSIARFRDTDIELLGNHLGNHVYPILLLVAPLYRLWPDPRLLLILQSVALGLGAAPLFWITQRKLRNRWWQVAVVVSYLLYPALGFVNLYDFHTIALTIPLLLSAYWALLEKRQFLFWVAILLALASREELVIPIAAFGLYCLFQPRWRKTGLRLLVVAALWALLCFGVIIPYFNEGRAFRYLELWSHLLQQQATGTGDGLDRMADTLGTSFYMSGIFVIFLLLPLGFLPLLGADILAVSLPSLAYLLLGSRPEFHRIGFHYPAILIPWWFLATVLGLARMERHARARHKVKLERLTLFLLLAGVLMGNVMANPILFTWLRGDFDRVPQSEQIRTALAQIPAEAGVATINSLGAQLANRRYLIELELYGSPLRWDHLQHIEYVLLDLADCRFVTAPDRRQAYAEMVYEILDSQQFGVRYWSGSILLLERGLALGQEVEEIRAYIDRLVVEERSCWPYED